MSIYSLDPKSFRKSKGIDPNAEAEVGEDGFVKTTKAAKAQTITMPTPYEPVDENGLGFTDHAYGRVYEEAKGGNLLSTSIVVRAGQVTPEISAKSGAQVHCFGGVGRVVLTDTEMRVPLRRGVMVPVKGSFTVGGDDELTIRVIYGSKSSLKIANPPSMPTVDE